MVGFVNFEGIFSFYEFKVSLNLIFKLIVNGRSPVRMLSEEWHLLGEVLATFY